MIQMRLKFIWNLGFAIWDLIDFLLEKEELYSQSDFKLQKV